VGIAVVTSVLGVVQVGARWQVYRLYSNAMEDAALTYAEDPADADGYSKFVKAVGTARRNYEHEYLKGVLTLSTNPSASSNS
jgi:hypothetical protein